MQAAISECPLTKADLSILNHNEESRASGLWLTVQWDLLISVMVSPRGLGPMDLSPSFGYLFWAQMRISFQRSPRIV